MSDILHAASRLSVTAMNAKRVAEILRAKDASNYSPPAVVLTPQFRDTLCAFIENMGELFDELALAIEQDNET